MTKALTHPDFGGSQPSAPQLGSLIDSLAKLKATKNSYQEQVDEVSKEMSVIEKQIIDMMESQKMSKATSPMATISLTSTATPNVDDYGLLYAYISRTKNFQLLQRRISTAAYAELKAAGKKIPGTSEYMRTSLRLTLLK